MKLLTLRDNLGLLKQISDNMFEDSSTGYLHCKNVIMGRTGIQKYKGYELGFNGDLKDTIISIERPASEVFSKDSLASLEDKAFTIGHPGENVNITNDSQLRKGSCKNIRQEDGVIKGDIIVYDLETIELIKNKELREVSLGYELELKKVSDTHYIATNIRYNHCALVYKGRAGVAKILDALYNKNIKKGGDMPNNDKNNQKRSLFDRIFNKPISDETYNTIIADDNVDEVDKIEKVEVEAEVKDNADANNNNDNDNDTTTPPQEIVDGSEENKGSESETQSETEDEDEDENKSKSESEDKDNDNESADDSSQPKEDANANANTKTDEITETPQSNEEIEVTTSDSQDHQPTDKSEVVDQENNEEVSINKKNNKKEIVDMKLTLEDIKKLPDGEAKEELLAKFKDSQDDYTEIVGDESKSINDEAVKILDEARKVEQSRRAFYDSFNPHKNKDFKKNTYDKEMLRDHLANFKFKI